MFCFLNATGFGLLRNSCGNNAGLRSLSKTNTIYPQGHVDDCLTTFFDVYSDICCLQCRNAKRRCSGASQDMQRCIAKPFGSILASPMDCQPREMLICGCWCTWAPTKESWAYAFPYSINKAFLCWQTIWFLLYSILRHQPTQQREEKAVAREQTIIARQSMPDFP